jgi:hypothetical protein
MTSIIIRCPACSKRNRIPSDKAGLKAKCGSCGHIISDVGESHTACKFCNRNVLDGIYLSDGGMIHESCLDSIHGEEEVTRNEIIKQQDKMERLRSEIKRREGILFKITSVFSKPNVDTDNIEKLISIADRNIAQLTNNLVSLQARVTSIYDYFLTYPPDWDNRRKEVVERDGEKCSKCWRFKHLHLHHISPLSEGGSNKISNLKLLCEGCHSQEHGGRDFSGEFSSSETAFSTRVANIRYAIVNGKRIKFGYKKPSDKSHIQRIVKPTELVNIDHHRDSESTLCVRGYCELRKAPRTFALKRMIGLRVMQV